MRERKPRYVASGLQALPVTRIPLWNESVLEQTKGQLRPKILNPNDPKMLRERLTRRGVTTLSTSELLSISLPPTKGSEGLLPKISSLLTDYSLQELLNADIGQLSQTLGDVKAAQLQSTLEIARRLLIHPDTIPYSIKSPQDAARYVQEMELLNREEMKVLLLDTKNQVVSNIDMYKGTVSSSVLRASEIFRPAIARNCPGIIIAHNHPSGSPEPSPEDIQVTEQLVQAGQVLDVDLIDHIIIGKNGNFTSLKERLRW